jgi:hypothetical protein
MVNFAEFLLFLALFAGVSPDKQIYAIRDRLSCRGIVARFFLPCKRLGTPEQLDCLKLRGGSSGEMMDVSAEEDFDFQGENGEVEYIVCAYSWQLFKLSLISIRSVVQQIWKARVILRAYPVLAMKRRPMREKNREPISKPLGGRKQKNGEVDVVAEKYKQGGSVRKHGP